ncbi:MAG: hypothetical protein ACR2FY_13820 [Pirellulaceae bacterium]
MTQVQDLELVVNEAMTRLETALLTPLVSGELESWVGEVREAAADLGTPLHDYVETVLHAQYIQIAKTDEELLSRVEKMIEEDKNLLGEYDGFLAELATLTARVPSAEKDELKVTDHRAHVETRGNALILRIRKQRAVASAWLSEAFYRDRGPVD